MSDRHIRTDDPEFKANFARYLREARASLSRLEDVASRVDVFRRREWFDDLYHLQRKADDIVTEAMKFAVARQAQG